jgi:hypothetical protein
LSKEVAGISSCDLFDLRSKRMVHKMKPELTLYLADEALKEKFSAEKVSMKEIWELQKDCRDYLSVENIRKIYARMMKIEMRRMMVEAVYRSLSSEDKEFVLLKYKKKKQVVAISLAMNMSIAQLNIRHHVILEKISEYMLYKLSEEDIYSREKVAMMVKLLGRIIEFAKEYDPTQEFISRNWLEAIKDRHDRYLKLQNEIDAVLDGNEDSVRHKVILSRMENPCEKIDVLARRCSVNKSVASRHLKNFVESMRQYLE